MAITNPQMMAGTQGVPEFLVVAAVSIGGASYRVGIRPIFDAAAHAGQFALAVAYRVRFQCDSGAHDPKVVEHTIKADKIGVHAEQVRMHYLKSSQSHTSFMVYDKVQDGITDTAYQSVKAAKKMVTHQVGCIYDHLTSLGFTLDHSRVDVGLFMLTQFETKCSQRGIDLGDLMVADVPQTQPFVEKYKAKTGGQPAPAVDPTPKAAPKADAEKPDEAKNDKYQLKTKEDLGELGFDALMDKLTKKKPE